MRSTNVTSLGTGKDNADPDGRGMPKVRHGERLKDGGGPGGAGHGNSWAEGDRHMRNRILKAPLAAGGIGLLAALAIPAAAQAGGTGGDTTTYPSPAIALDKTGAATANAGDTFTYSFALTNVTLTDDKCQDTLTRDPAETDDAFDPADVWHYTCTVIAPEGPAEVHNVAEVTAKYSNNCKTKTVTATDDHTFTVPATPPVTPPVTPPADTPPGVTPPAGTPPAGTPPAGTPPAGGAVLPEQVISGRAALRGPSGCVKQAFRASVSGRSIASVTFYMDGKRMKRVSGPGSLRINPKRIGFGRHRVVALVRFTEASGTPSRRLPLTFRRCARQVVNPQFTG
jgi:hypothetical protein